MTKHGTIKHRSTKMTTNPAKPHQGMDEELIAMLKYLRLGRLLSHWDETWRKPAKDVTRPSDS